jgi:hypothetical protein
LKDCAAHPLKLGSRSDALWLRLDLIPSAGEKCGQPDATKPQETERDRTAMAGSHGLVGYLAGAAVEAAMGAVVAVCGLEQIDRRVSGNGFIGQLTLYPVLAR